MLKYSAEYERDTSQAKFMAISHQVSLASLPDVSACYCRRYLMDELGMIRTQMGTHNKSEIVAVLGTPCAIPPRNVNSNSNRNNRYVIFYCRSVNIFPLIDI
jgi:hypothetical protein